MVEYSFMENPETRVKIIDRGDERLVLVPRSAVKAMAIKCEGRSGDFILDLFKAVVPEFDEVNAVEPTRIKMDEAEVGPLMTQFRVYNSGSWETMNMAWLNCGFSVLDSPVPEKIGPIPGYYRIFYRPGEALDWGPGGRGEDGTDV